MMAKSRNPEELEYYWTQWRKATGERFRDLYLEHIDLKNEAAKLNGYSHSGQSQSYKRQMARTWAKLRPLYQELHAYVRHKLFMKYGGNVIDANGPIPAHLLGNMWAQRWNHINDILRPFPNKPDINVTYKIIEQDWTPKKIFQVVDDFYQSLGLDPMSEVNKWSLQFLFGTDNHFKGVLDW